MNFKNYEKALYAPVMKVVAELSIKSKSNLSTKYGNLYICYRKKDQSIKIGFTDSLKNIVQKKNGYRLIKNKCTSVREEKLLKATLNELGHKPMEGANDYKYSRGLINHLKILGWKIGDLIKE